MRKAKHPYHWKYITVAEYIKDMGAGAPQSMEERPICPVCGQRMTVVAANTACTSGHFSHLPKSDFCPTKEKAGARYQEFPPTSPDMEAARRMKEYFERNWQIHFSQLDFFVKGLSKIEFLEALTLADRARIWEYAHLEIFHIPYILATLMDFPPERSRKNKDKNKIREKYFRCFFDATVQRYDDLWIDRPNKLQFWRAWYESRSGKKPRVDDLISAYPSEICSEFLEYKPKVPPFYIDEIQKWITHRYGTAQ